jgi:hypothetical protein
MAMLLASGIGSILAQEVGKLALDHAPLMKQVATNAVVDVAKKSFDYVLSENPNFASFLGHFGITKFNSGNTHSTFTKRGKHRRITYHNH